MDVRDSSQRNVDFMTAPVAILMSSFLISGLISTVFINISVGFLCFVGIYVVSAIRSADILNSELSEDGYAPLSRLHALYVGAFLVMITSPLPLSYYLSLPVSVVVSILAGGLLILLLRGIALRNIHNREVEKDTVVGPPVVYNTKGPYISHIEESVADESVEE